MSKKAKGKGKGKGKPKKKGTYTGHLLTHHTCSVIIKLVPTVSQDKGVKYVIAVMNASNCYIHMSIASCSQYFYVYWYLLSG